MHIYNPAKICGCEEYVAMALTSLYNICSKESTTLNEPYVYILHFIYRVRLKYAQGNLTHARREEERPCELDNKYYYVLHMVFQDKDSRVYKMKKTVRMKFNTLPLVLCLKFLVFYRIYIRISRSLYIEPVLVSFFLYLVFLFFLAPRKRAVIGASQVLVRTSLGSKEVIGKPDG